jgi:hypothetical protein
MQMHMSDGRKDLTDEELRVVSKEVGDSSVESEVTLCAHKLKLDQIAEELEFRKSGKVKRPAAGWAQFWFDSIRDIAASHNLHFNKVWEIAKKVEAGLKPD